MPDDFTVPLEYIAQIGEELSARGIELPAWLAGAGLSEAALSEPDGVVAAADFERLVRDALRLSREPALGLFVGQRMVLATHGIVGEVAVRSEDVRQAVLVVERFAGLRSTLIAISHETMDARTRLRFEAPVPLPPEVLRPVLEAVVLSVKNLLTEITLGQCLIDEVSFPFAAPDYAPLARDLLGCPVHYGRDWAGFAADARQLDVPLSLADPAAFEIAAKICQRQLDAVAAGDTLAAQVRRILLQRKGGFPTLQVTARTLHMTPRTLHRRLTDEGTSYRELSEAVRHGLALEHLRSGRFTLKELAFHLGYTDVANFRRAFKRWEGVAPATYRTQCDGR